jgi:hypothetical protein
MGQENFCERQRQRYAGQNLSARRAAPTNVDDVKRSRHGQWHTHAPFQTQRSCTHSPKYTKNKNAGKLYTVCLSICCAPQSENWTKASPMNPNLNITTITAPTLKRIHVFSLYSRGRAHQQRFRSWNQVPFSMHVRSVLWFLPPWDRHADCANVDDKMLMSGGR